MRSDVFIVDSGNAIPTARLQIPAGLLQRGHANPVLTLRVYAHALREEEADLSFLDFGGTKRHPRGSRRIGASATKNPIA